MKLWVLDTSALVTLGSPPRSTRQANEVLNLLAQRIHELAFSGHVVKELERRVPPDLIARWAKQHRPSIPFEDPSWEVVKAVLEVAPGLLEDKVHEDYDPQIVAFALSIQQAYTQYEVIVVTEDRRDRLKTSMTTACRMLGLRTSRLEPFLKELGAT